MDVERLVEEVAREIADGLGDNFDHAFVSKSEWNAARGEKGGRYRDINEPRQGDYTDAARSAILATLRGVREANSRALAAGVISAVGGEPTPADLAAAGAVLEHLPPTGHPAARSVIADVRRDYRAVIDNLIAQVADAAA